MCYSELALNHSSEILDSPPHNAFSLSQILEIDYMALPTTLAADIAPCFYDQSKYANKHHSQPQILLCRNPNCGISPLSSVIDEGHFCTISRMERAAALNWPPTECKATTENCIYLFIFSFFLRSHPQNSAALGMVTTCRFGVRISMDVSSNLSIHVSSSPCSADTGITGVLCGCSSTTVGNRRLLAEVWKYVPSSC